MYILRESPLTIKCTERSLIGSAHSHDQTNNLFKLLEYKPRSLILLQPFREPSLSQVFLPALW